MGKFIQVKSNVKTDANSSVKADKPHSNGVVQNGLKNGNKNDFKRSFNGNRNNNNRRGGNFRDKRENNQKKSSFEIKIPRLILRNLSFKVNEEKLKDELGKYGSLVEISLPKNPDGKLRGYGFVKYAEMSEASKAIENINGNKSQVVLGTNVACDWCLPKNLYIKTRDAQNNTNNANETKKIEPKLDKEEESEKEVDDDNEDDNDDDDDNDDNDSDKNGDEDGDDDEDDDVTGSENEDDEGSDKDDDESENEDEKDDKSNKKPVNPKFQEKLKKKAEVGSQDVLEKRTIFIRNINFDTSEEELKKSFEKYGEIKYCKLCIDRDFERPKGTAFIQFVNAQSALNACTDSNILEVDSRKLQIDLAISRKQVTDITNEKNEKLPKDNRNMSLAKEGVVYPNSYEAKGLSKSDLDKRAKIESSNTAKLKLLHHFVSTTRLSVHNIPIKCTDAELKTIYLNALNENKHDAASNKHNSYRIIECRIMRDLTRVNSEGVAKSRGYGFVEFRTHEDAYKALHATNNNPNIFPDKKTRLIVQFSIEDMRALKKRARRIEKSSNSSNTTTIKRSNKSRSKNSTFNTDDSEENIEKKRERNLIRTRLVERKLNKRKAEEENKLKKKNSKKLKPEKEKNNEKSSEESNEKKIKLAMKKREKNRIKRLKQKNKAIKDLSDNVDNLINKYMKEKDEKKLKKKKKWFQ